MNNHQLLNALRTVPQHPLHKVEMSNAFARWLTLTAQPSRIGGMSLEMIRQTLLDELYEDWKQYRGQTIE